MQRLSSQYKNIEQTSIPIIFPVERLKLGIPIHLKSIHAGRIQPAQRTNVLAMFQTRPRPRCILLLFFLSRRATMPHNPVLPPSQLRPILPSRTLRDQQLPGEGRGLSRPSLSLRGVRLRDWTAEGRGGEGLALSPLPPPHAQGAAGEPRGGAGRGEGGLVPLALLSRAGCLLPPGEALGWCAASVASDAAFQASAGSLPARWGAAQAWVCRRRRRRKQ